MPLGRCTGAAIGDMLRAAGITLLILVAMSAPAGVNRPDYTYQVWDGLGSGEPLIVRVPVVVSVTPESQFAAIFMPTRPLQITPAPVGEINLAVLCGFKHRLEQQRPYVLVVTIDAAQARCPGEASTPYLEMVANLVRQCAEKVAREQLARYAPEQEIKILLRLHWGDNDERNIEKVIERAN